MNGCVCVGAAVVDVVQFVRPANVCLCVSPIFILVLSVCLYPAYNDSWTYVNICFKINLCFCVINVFLLAARVL